MERYIIETPHSPDDCAKLVDQVYAMGYLYHFDWGCKAGVHSGWAIIEAEDDAQARLAVPPMFRKQARVVQLNKFHGEHKLFHEAEKEQY